MKILIYVILPMLSYVLVICILDIIRKYIKRRHIK